MSHISQKGPYHYTYLSKGDDEEKRSRSKCKYYKLDGKCKLTNKLCICYSCDNYCEYGMKSYIIEENKQSIKTSKTYIKNESSFVENKFTAEDKARMDAKTASFILNKKEY